MKTLHNVVLIASCLFLCLQFSIIHGQLIDPYDMNKPLKGGDSFIDPKNLEAVNINEALTIKTGKGLKKGNQQTLEEYIHLKRLVSLLLHNAHLEYNDPFYIGHINLNIHREDFDFFKKFTKNYPNDNVDNLLILDVIERLEKAVQKTNFEKFSHRALNLKKWLFEMIFNHETAILFLLVVVLYVMYKLFQAQFTGWQIAKYIFWMLYIVDFFITYMHLRENEFIDDMTKMKQYQNVPPECQPSKMSWGAWIGHVIGSNNACKDYHLLLFRNINYYISPLKVFVKQIGNFSDVLEHMGQAFGRFANSMFRELPYGLNFLLFPIMVMVFLIFTTISMVIVFKTPINISTMFFKIKFGGEQNTTPQIKFLKSSMSHSNHRALIEDIPDDESNKTNKIKENDEKSTNDDEGKALEKSDDSTKNSENKGQEQKDQK